METSTCNVRCVVHGCACRQTERWVFRKTRHSPRWKSTRVQRARTKLKAKPGKAAVWCSKCKCALCTNHVVAHLMSGSGPSSRVVGDLPKSSMLSLANDFLQRTFMLHDIFYLRHERLTRKMTIIVSNVSVCYSEEGVTHRNVGDYYCHLSRHPFVSQIKYIVKSSMTSDAEESVNMCKEHGSPLKYFCKRCNVAVCGDCIRLSALTKTMHRPVVLMKDVNAELHAKVQANAQRLKTVALPRAESAITNVDQVTVELAEGAKKLRGEVRAAAERAVNTIRASEQQKLQEIDDIEVVRLKTLDRQKDELKRHTEALKTAIALTNKLAQGQEGGGKAAGRLLETLDKRTTELERAKISDTPERHLHISFETVSNDDLIAKANELVGKVIPCEASAQHSLVEGDHNQTVQEGQSTTFTRCCQGRQEKPIDTRWGFGASDGVEQTNGGRRSCTSGGQRQRQRSL